VSQAAPASILVAGVGNLFLGDDGFGCEVARRLAVRGLGDHVHVEDYGIRGFDLAHALSSGVSAAVLIDAAPHGSIPGSLVVMDATPFGPATSHDAESVVETHGMDPVHVLRLAAVLGTVPRRVLVVGVEPDRTDPDEAHLGTLSEPVAAAVDGAVALVRELVGALIDERGHERGKEGQRAAAAT
jgi:hydrogenase maturation protease